MLTALVPVKALELSKSRLRNLLPPEIIRELALAMLRDVLTALLETPGIDRIAVVTPDATVASVAKALGAQVLVRQDAGLNLSLTNAATQLAEEGMTELLVVMGDIPGVTSKALTTMLALRGELGSPGVIIAVSDDGGTTALLRAPWNVIPNAYGPESSSRHYDLAMRAKVPVRCIRTEGLRLDLDQPEDIEMFLESESHAQHTRQLLDRVWTRKACAKGKSE